MSNRTRTAGFTLALLLAVAGLSTGCFAGGPAASPQSGSQGQRAVDFARSQIGVRYTYGGSSPSTGFDCSGLTGWAWAQAGKYLPRSAAEQYWATTRLWRSEMVPGDLIFYGFNGNIQHEAMYIGGGMMVQAQKTGTVINEQNVDTWWTEAIIGYGRVR